MFLPNGLISLTYSVPDYYNIQTIVFLLVITRQLILVRHNFAYHINKGCAVWLENNLSSNFEK